MLKPFVIYCIVVLLFCTDYYVFCESNLDKQSVERQDDGRLGNDLKTCIDNFEVYKDKIIRTTDSREMGAKYLNKLNVLSRSSCQRFCCETDNCDVFVFEEKAPGTCYLFECGKPENFKCKFTKYENYTSAVLVANRRSTGLESQIKLTQDEHELTSLRHHPGIQSLSKFHPSTTNSPKSQQTMSNGLEQTQSQAVLSSINRQLVKRRDDGRQDNELQTCLDNFDVHEDKIIRTQDSREMGAKYINERDVLSRDDCLRLCCETDNCDVFVFEEKTPGSCYLFECGTPEDFKCKFTKHKNYTSAVLAINRHLTELESQIKFTQHEHELTNLRQPSETQSLPKLLSSTTNSPRSLETIGSGIERPPQTITSKGDKCSQYQFKCHTSGECIGIYNACDGIPQCADGSDEAPELGCPTSTPSPVVTTQNPSKNEGKPDFKTIEEHKKEIGKSPTMNGQQPYAVDGPMMNGYPQNIGPPNSPVNAPVPNPYYGREGEGMINHHSDQWPAHLYHQSQGSSQIFNHKGNGIMPQKSEWYYQHPYVPQDIPQQPVISQYGEQGPNYYDNMAYRMPPQGQPNWQGPHKVHEVGGQQINEDGGMGRLDRIPVVNPPGPAEDYYEEVYRNRPYLPPRLPVAQSPSLHQPIDPKETPIEMSNDDTGTKHDVPKKKPPTEPSKITTSKPKDVTLEHVSHRKVDKISAELKSKELFAEEDVDGHNTTPSGAVLSLTMGLCMTGIMLVFVGCRMRVVKRRMRRGGKSPYAHDADFLVNGMYL